MTYCGYRWSAPRRDVPESVPVEHVCALERGHIEILHFCACGCMELFK